MSASGSASGFLASYESASHHLFSHIERSCSAQGSWPAGVRAATAAALALFAADPQLARTIVYQVDSEGPEAHIRHEATLARLAGMLRQGREDSDARALPEHVEESLVGGLLFLVGRPLRNGEAASLPSLAPDLTAFLLTPYVGSEEAERLARDTN